MDNGSFDKLINRIIDKRYKIENVVGVGGMAYVLKAKDILNNRDVAVKMLSDEFKSDERAVKRFINESKTVSMLDHDNIVKILDVVINDERKYIVMEFIDGITLKDYTNKLGALSWKEAVHYVRQVLLALSHAHEKQIIHRDIKPQNIMLLSDGSVKVTDFGIAKMPNAESITVTDKAIGTVNYISPEQASGMDIDFRTDIYSAGVMLYEMLTGRLPFIAESPVAVAMMHVSNEPMTPREVNPEIPAGLEQIVLKAMQKNPDDRFLSAEAMLKALDYFSHNPDVVFAGSVTDTGAAGAKVIVKESEKKKARLKKYIRGSRSMFPLISGVAAAFAVVAIVFVIVWVLPFFGKIEKPEDGENTIDVLGESLSTAMDSFLGVGDNTEARKVAVPSFVGEEYGEALEKAMKEQGFGISTVNYVKNAKYPPNTVVRQDPEADSIRLRPENGKLLPVTLYVNMGGKEIEMPDCTLMSTSDAKKLIRKAVNAASEKELDVNSIKIEEEFHDTYPAGYVIRTVPEAKTVVNITENEEYILVVSKGREVSSTIVPPLKGFSLDEAKRAIVASRLAIGHIEYEPSEEVPAGYVISASYESGDIVAGGLTSVDLLISTGSANGGSSVEPGVSSCTQTGSNYGEGFNPNAVPEYVPETETQQNQAMEDIAGLLDLRNSGNE